MEAIKIKSPVIGKIFKADEQAEFLSVNDYLRHANYEYEIRFFFNAGAFAGGLILTETQPRDEIKFPCFLRFSDYELQELPHAIRSAIKQDNKKINATIKRTPTETTYEAHYERNGYNIAVASASVSDLKSKFIEAAIAVTGG